MACLVRLLMQRGQLAPALDQPHLLIVRRIETEGHRRAVRRVRPSLIASLAARSRVEARWLLGIAHTWCSTIPTEMNELAAITSLD